MSSTRIIAIGELLIDFIAEETGSLTDVQFFQKFPGGAPANFAVGISRLGFESFFVGKVGSDPFGDFLVKELEKEGVKTNYIFRGKKDQRTTLAFVSLDELKKPSFLFYRENAADSALSPEEITKELFAINDFLMVGSVALTKNPCRAAIFKAIKLCKQQQGMVCFDPNIRLDLWNNRQSLRKTIERVLNDTAVFLPSEKEVHFLIPDKSLTLEEKMDKLFSDYPLKVIAVKLGANGCLLQDKDGLACHVLSFAVEAEDTTGAGDGFNAGMIYGLASGLSSKMAATLGNAVAALVIQKKGAMSALPTKSELQTFLQKQNILLPEVK
jgi:fructokinase